MSRVTRVRDIAAPPSRVWAVLADFDDLASWASNADHTCSMSDQTEGVGTVRRVQAGRVVLVERVVTWEPELMLSYTIDGLPPVVRRVSNTWVLRPEGDGTSVSLITDVDAGGGPRRLIAAAVARRLATASDTMLAGLAAHLEETP